MNDLPELIAVVLLSWAAVETLAIIAGYINRLLKTVTRDD